MSSDRSMPLERLHRALASDGAVCMAWMTIPDPYLAEIVAANHHGGVVALDMQHGLFDHRAAVEAIRAVSGQAAAPLVRLAGFEPSPIAYLLDAGAAGLILPTVETVHRAEAFVRASRYPPDGFRSYGPTRTAFMGAESARHPILLAMIETAKGLESAHAIAAVSGIDGLFIGPGDLGLSLGIGHGQNRTETEIFDAIKLVKAAVEDAGKFYGIHATCADYARRQADAGAKVVTTWVDVAALGDTFSRTRRTWDE